ncbi:MAG: sulfatase [Planctomycetes bacterium]|nr:sulfatase [Planctomycetota bacterium]
MTDAPTPAAPKAPAKMWLGAGLFAAGVSVLIRLYGLPAARVHHLGADPDFATLVALALLPELLIHGIVPCCAATIVLRTEGARSYRWAARLFAAILFGSAMSGWPLAAAPDLPSMGAPLGPANLLFIVSTALLLTLFVELLPRAIEGTKPTAVLALIGVALPGSWLARTLGDPPRATAHVVVAELLDESERWTLGAIHPEHKPETGVLTPWVAYEVDGGDKPALIMPPPCEASFVVLPEDGPVRLRLSAGVDHSVDAALGPETPQAAFGFEVLVDGAPAYETIIEVQRGAGDGLARAWRHPERELALQPGQRVTLRTRVAAGEGVEAAGCKVGFGTLVLERETAHPRLLATPERPSIVVFVMDTQRTHRMSCYRYRDHPTPHTDALASRGTLFEEAYATSSWTWPATASILTGLVPEEHGVLSNDSCTLALSNESLPEVLLAEGYATGAFSCNPLIAPERYFDQGFEQFDSGPFIRHTGDVIDGVEEWIASRAGARFFLYLHLADPHTPHEPLPEELERLGHEQPEDYHSIEHEGRTYDRMDLYARNLLRQGTRLSEEVPEHHQEWIHQVYDASVATGDHYLGRIMAKLDELGLGETTVVALTSDHGEELFDHERLAHGHTLHAELVKVPLLLAGPGIPARRVSEPISNRHLAPTLARIGGAELPQAADALMLFEEELPARSVSFQTGKGAWEDERGQRLFGIRKGDFVLHHNADSQQRAWSLYEVSKDPYEQVDLSETLGVAGTQHDLFETMQRELTAARARRRGVAVGVGSGGISNLEGIGYIDVFDDEEDGQ